jgi:hypothetical protein
MSKAVGVFFACAMLVQIIRPIGLPGLRRRGDAWKLAVAGLFAMVATLGLGAG